MTRRLVLLACVLATALVSAQNGTFSSRFGSNLASDAGNQPPTIAVTSPSPPGTGVTTSPQTLMGIAGDDLGLASVTCSVNTGASCTISGDLFTWTATVGAGPGLSSGANLVTVIVTDTGMPALTAQTTFTYTLTPPPDPTPPVVTITTNGGLAITTTSNTFTLQGTCTDNVACSSIKYILDGGAETNCSNTANWTCNNIPLTVAMHTVGVKGYDAAGNSHTDTISIERTSTSCTISLVITPTGPVTTSTNDLDISGSVTAACGIDEVRCGSDSYTNTWQYARHANWLQVNGSKLSVPFTSDPVPFTSNNRQLKFGSNTYSCWASDTQGNTQQSNLITVTYNKPAAILTTKVPPVRVGVPMQSWDLIPDGGVGTYAWDNGSGSNSIGCGLIITDTTVSGVVVGRISGTPNTLGPCTANVRLTATSSASLALTINGQSGALPGPNDHWSTMNSLCTGTNCTKILALRLSSQSEITAYSTLDGNTANPNYTANGSFAVVTWPLNPDTQASDTLAPQMFFPIDKTTGTVLIQFDALLTYSWLPYNCRPGGRNMFFDTGQAWKSWQVRMTESAQNDSVIYFETRNIFSNTSCTVPATLDDRLYANDPGAPAGQTIKNPQTPTGLGALDPQTYQILPNAWTTITIETVLNLTENDFPEWHTLTGATLAAGTYHKQSVYAQNEYEDTASKILFRVPEDLIKGAMLGPYDKVRAFNFEYDSSNPAGTFNSGVVPMIMCLRNLSIIYNYTFSDTANPVNDTTIFQKPVRDTVACAP